MSKQPKPYRIIISGGGTGGHIYPAIAIANLIRQDNPASTILFVGDKSRMEMEKVPREGYEIIGLWISGIQRRLTLKNLLFPIKLIHSLITCSSIIRKFKPDIAIGVGGYASAPLLYTAARKGVPCLIQEQNSYAGLANKWLSSRVNKICVAYEGMESYFPAEKIVITGNPVRGDIGLGSTGKEECAAFFGLNAEKPVLLILGGSLGARTINESIVEGWPKLSVADIQVIWQTGKLYLDDIKSKMEGKADQAFISDFIYEMDKAYGAADVIIARAGALTLSELSLVGAASILVPSPNVAEDHQTKNARALEKEAAALMVPDKAAKNELVKEALNLLQDDSKQEQLKQNIKQFARPQAARDIVNEVYKLAG